MNGGDRKVDAGASDDVVAAHPNSWIGQGLPREVREALTSGMTGSELWSLLLGVMAARAASRTPATLRQQWANDRFVQPSAVDQRTLNEIDGHLLAAAAEKGFESIELSPVAPLGTCSVIAPASQNKIVSTARGTEVVSDPTNVLALECAARLAKDDSVTVRLTTTHRCVRAQPFPNKPGYAAHFRMFCLASAGRERANREFLASELAAHINAHLSALDRLEQHGYRFSARQVRMLATEPNTQIAQDIAGMIASVPVTHAPLDHAYYDGLRFMIHTNVPGCGGDAGGESLPLIDGGAFDWMRKLLANDKMTFIASGMGSQVAAMAFRTPVTPSLTPR